MATVSGNSITYSDNYIVVSHRAIINYSVSQTDTTYKVTINSIQDYNESIGLGGATRNFTISSTLAATGYSNATYSASRTTGQAVTTTLASNLTRQWDKGTSAQTKTISFTTTVGDKSSTASFSITVPALASCSVIYNANGGTGAPTSQTKYYNTALTLTTNKPVKSGYTFKGWATSTSHASVGTVDYASGGTIAASVSVSDNINLYAVWELTYQKPEIHNLTVERCNQDGSDNDEGKYAKVSFDWSVFSSTAARYYGGSGTGPYANNSATCSITVGSVTVTPTLSGSSGSVSGVIVGSGAYDVDSQYSVTVSVTDTQAIVSDHTTTEAGILSPSTFPMDFNADATAVGFFMPAPDNASGMFLSGDMYLDLPDYNASGTVDYDLYEAIVALGWEDDVLVD